jgi:Tol biopolymer transport system component
MTSSIYNPISFSRRLKYTYNTVIVIIFILIFGSSDLLSQQRPASLENTLYLHTRIAFASNRDGNFEIYIMDADGSRQTNLTNSPTADEYPSWSPDGTKIAFTSKRDGNSEVYVMNADGSQQTRLTDNPAYDAFPSWSPDGKKIAYASERAGNMDVYVMNADGSQQTRITNNPAHDVKPYWSPDGKKIAFQSTRNGKEEIYVMNADGSEQSNLTNNPAWDGCLSWSPDGKKIAFASNRDGDCKGQGYECYRIYVMNADGSHQTRLTNSHAMCPSWSPDGKKIVFYSLVNDMPEETDKGVKARWWFEYNSEIYIMNSDGTKQTNLTNNPAYDGYPCWSPFLKTAK